MSTASAQAHARAAVRGCAALGGKLETLRTRDGEVTIDGYIERSSANLGVDYQIGEPRFRAVLMAADIVGATRGDRLTDEDGTFWFLNDELDGDGIVTYWSVERQ